MRNHLLRTLLYSVCGLSLATAWGVHQERIRLYSPPDPDSQGGITGRITYPAKPIHQVLAIPPDEPRLVYKGTVSGSEKNTFTFAGLPMRKYDLVIIYEDQFYEGLQLHRERNSLTAADRKKIEQSIQKSEPYFLHKEIHRLEGSTGRGNTARLIGTYMRDKPSESWMAEVEGGGFVRPDSRRTFKVVMLKDVGPGWQIVRARDLYPVWCVPPVTSRPRHVYREQLSRIRVTDYLKDLGEIDLTK